MALKHGNLLVYSGPSDNESAWATSVVTLYEDGNLKITPCVENPSGQSKTLLLTTDWSVVAPRLASAVDDLPTLPRNKKIGEIFALSFPPKDSTWFLTYSKFERDQWVEKILQVITLKPDTPSESPPPYLEYDNYPGYQWCAPSPPIKEQPKRLPSRSGLYEVQMSEIKLPDVPDTSPNVTTSTQHHDVGGIFQVCCPFFQMPDVSTEYCCTCGCCDCCEVCCSDEALGVCGDQCCTCLCAEC